MTYLCFSMKPPLQFPSARPGTLLRSALAPSPSQQAFVLVTLKGRAVFQRPADAICKDMRAFLWVPRYEVIVLAAHLAGLSRQSKFNGAAATAGAATCAARTLNSSLNFCWAVFIRLVLVGQHAGQPGIHSFLPLQQHRAVVGVPSKACWQVCAHVCVYVWHKKRRKLMLFDRDGVFLDRDTWPVVHRTE